MRSFADLLRPQGLHILALPLRRALRRPLRLALRRPLRLALRRPIHLALRRPLSLALRRLPHHRQMTWTRKTIL